MTINRTHSQYVNNGATSVPTQIAGKNAIINGGMDIWQRGTSVAGTGWLAADRWYQTSANITSSRETTVVPTNFQYSIKGAVTSGSSAPQWGQTIETANAMRFAGKTVTLSAYIATSDSSTGYLRIDYATTTDESITGSYTILGYSSPTATSSMPASPQSITLSIPSNAKTLRVYVGSSNAIASGGWCAVTGVQLELGSVATPFTRAGGSIGSELALCQRYYYRMTSNWGGPYAHYGTAVGSSTTNAYGFVTVPVTMRIAPTSVDFSTVRLWRGSTDAPVVTNIILTGYWIAPYQIGLSLTTASGLTDNTFYFFGANNNSASYLGFNAEL